MEENKKTNVKGFVICLLIAVILIVTVIYFLVSDIWTKNVNNNSKKSESKLEVETNNIIENETSNKTQAETKEVISENEYAIKDNNLSKFDLSFLKFENKKENKIYSPLSIKYAFKMLEEGTTGKSHEQINSIINAYNLTEYETSENIAIANAFFIKDSYKDNIKKSYINALKTKYNADIEYDDFSNADKINLWVKNHTLDLIPELFQDSDVGNLKFALVNALGIDMEWKHKFLNYFYDDDKNITMAVEYNHAKMENDEYAFSWNVDESLYGKKFDDNQLVSSMKVEASLNNYDAVKELGEENIRETVYNDFKDFALGNGNYKDFNGKNDTEFFENDYSEEGIKKAFEKWFNNGTTEYWEGTGKSFIDDLNENYGRVDYSTDFSIYVNDDVKVFAKDLDEYNGTTLQYIGIMPKEESLDNYIEKTTNQDIQKLISNLKELKRENFKDGYLTYIHGYIPKFKFEYELNLKDDLETLGITDVFEQGKANLTKMTDEDAYIDVVKHKANIEFTQDGIKAAAAIGAGGLGAGSWYDYFIEMPTQEIDITFDIFIRDKNTKEIWFVGTVYEPLDFDDEPSEFNLMAPEDRE